MLYFPTTIWSWLLLILGLFVAMYALRFILHSILEMRRKKLDEAEETVVLQIRVGRENERGPIVMEQVFATLHGIYKKLSWMDRLRGLSQKRISLEIANIDNKVRFYVWAPKKLQGIVENQMYAQYPEIEIEVIEDYASRKDVPKSLDFAHAVGAELELSGVHLYPIKRYNQFEDRMAQVNVDPLAGITAALSQLNGKDEQAWMQIVVSPVGDYWRKKGLRVLRILTKLCSRGIFKRSFTLQNWAAKIYMTESWFSWFLLQPVYLLLWIMRGGGAGVISESEGQSSGPELSEEVSRQHDRETADSAAVAKITQLGFETNVRFMYVPQAQNFQLAETKLREIAGSFKQFTIPHSNGFQMRTFNKFNQQLLRRFKRRALINPYVLSIEELATVYHLPNILVQTPNIQWVHSKRLEPPVDLPVPEQADPSDFTTIGMTNFRGDRRKFGIKGIDRRRHIYIIGKTGMGKSTLLENMIFSDILQGKGVAIIDPHGDLADAVINFVPKNRTNDVIVFDPADTEFPVSFNMMDCKLPEHRTLVASGLIGVFKKMYGESWGPRLEHILRNTILALLETPNTTMLGIMRMLVDNKFRKRIVKNVTNPMVRSFWLDEFAKYQDRMRTEAVSPIQNKVGQFLSSPVIRNIVGQVKSAFDIRYAMDNNKIVVVNLSKGKLGEDNSALLGSMLITKFQLDAMSRADISAEERKDFYLYVDEFQNFATDSFATILSEARKYKLNLTMANQYIAQMPDEVRDAVFGNVGTMISFQVGYDDADVYSKQYSEEISPNDIVALPKYTAYTKLLVDGVPTKVFSCSTLPPPQYEEHKDSAETIRKVSREKYGTPKEVVEDKILRWSGMKDQGGGADKEDVEKEK